MTREKEINYIPESVLGHSCFCGKPAVRKIEEVVFKDDPMLHRHPLTNWVCFKHFKMIMKRYYPISDCCKVNVDVKFAHGGDEEEGQIRELYCSKCGKICDIYDSNILTESELSLLRPVVEALQAIKSRLNEDETVVRMRDGRPILSCNSIIEKSLSTLKEKMGEV